LIQDDTKIIINKYLENINLQTHIGSTVIYLYNHDFLSSDLRVNPRQVSAMHYMYTKFGADSLSRFSFKAWTHRHTDKFTHRTDHPTHALVTAGLGNGNYPAIYPSKTFD